MTGHYVRRTVPLEFGDLSRDIYDNFPRPESAGENQGDSYRPYGMADVSGTVTPVSISMSEQFPLAPYWSGGPDNTTERSSVFSLTDDEFDCKLSDHVKQLFDNIELMLFEHCVDLLPAHSRIECNDWTGTFPHLRVVGELKMAPLDLGYQIYPSYNTPGGVALGRGDICGGETIENDSTGERLRSTSHAISSTLPSTHQSSSSSDHDQFVLSVQGYQLNVQSPHSLVTSGLYSHARAGRDMESTLHRSSLFAKDVHGGGRQEEEEEEEVLAQDGVIEEIFAIDHQPSDFSNQQMTAADQWLSSGLPPVTPTACARTNILLTIFTDIWTEAVVGSMDGLLARYFGKSLAEDAQTAHTLYSIANQDPAIVAGYQLMLDSTSHDGGAGFHLIRESTVGSARTGMSEKLTRQSSLLSGAGGGSSVGDGMGVVGGGGRQLDGLLTVQSKALQNRLESSELGSVRPTSSNVTNQQQPFGRPYSKWAGERTNSARGGGPRNIGVGRGRLAPISASERIKTPSVDEDRLLSHNSSFGRGMIRGYKMSTINERRIASPPSPPISSSHSLHATNAHISQSATPSGHLPGPPLPPIKRMNSAALQKGTSKTIGARTDRTWPPHAETRPSTMHSLYLSEGMPSTGGGTGGGLVGGGLGGTAVTSGGGSVPLRSSTTLGFNRLVISHGNAQPFGTVSGTYSKSVPSAATAAGATPQSNKLSISGSRLNQRLINSSLATSINLDESISLTHSSTMQGVSSRVVEAEEQRRSVTTTDSVIENLDDIQPSASKYGSTSFGHHQAVGSSSSPAVAGASGRRMSTGARQSAIGYKAVVSITGTQAGQLCLRLSDGALASTCRSTECIDLAIVYLHS